MFINWKASIINSGTGLNPIRLRPKLELSPKLTDQVEIIDAQDPSQTRVGNVCISNPLSPLVKLFMMEHEWTTFTWGNVSLGFVFNRPCLTISFPPGSRYYNLLSSLSPSSCNPIILFPGEMRSSDNPASTKTLEDILNSPPGDYN